MSTSHQYQQAPEVLNWEFPYQSLNPLITPLLYYEKPWKLSKSELRRTTILSCIEAWSGNEFSCSKNQEGRLKGSAKQSGEVQGNRNVKDNKAETRHELDVWAWERDLSNLCPSRNYQQGKDQEKSEPQNPRIKTTKETEWKLKGGAKAKKTIFVMFSSNFCRKKPSISKTEDPS